MVRADRPRHDVDGRAINKAAVGSTSTPPPGSNFGADSFCSIPPGVDQSQARQMAMRRSVFSQPSRLLSRLKISNMRSFICPRTKRRLWQGIPCRAALVGFPLPVKPGHPGMDSQCYEDVNKGRADRGNRPTGQYEPASQSVVEQRCSLTRRSTGAPTAGRWAQ